MKRLAITSLVLFLSVQFGYGQTSNPTKEELVLRISQLTQPDAAMPDNESLLVREIDRVDDEMAEATRIMTQPDYKSYIEQNERAKSEVASAISDLKSLACSTELARFNLILGKIESHFRFDKEILWDADAQAPDTSSFGIFYREYSPPTSANSNQEERCKSLQGQLSKPETVNAVLAVFDDWRSKLNDSQQKLLSYRELNAKRLDLLKQRRAALQERVNAKTPAQQISSSLWIIMIVIGGFSIGTILIIKLFSPELQMEWVTSGQVIQFVTVMILLSVIMALGLSGILHENTLGTLLGGIAGYVLAQGVGRAAAREVSRTASANMGRTEAAHQSTPVSAPEAEAH